MKRVYFVAFICMGLFLYGCNRDDDILAVYKDGKITRGEFNEWIEVNHYKRESIEKNKKQVRDKLKKLFIDRIAALEARKIGFDKNEDFRLMHDMSTEQQLMKVLYKREILEGLKFEEPVVKISHIYIKVRDFKIEKNKRVKLSDEEINSEIDKSVSKGRGIIERLNKGEKFELMAKNFSNDFSRRRGGDIGYQIYSMLPPEYARVAFALEEGDYTKEPVKIFSEKPTRLPNGVYIIKVTDKDTLTEKNIEDIITNKVDAKRLKNSLLRRKSQEFLQNLMKAADVEIALDKAVSKNGRDVIFRVGDLVYTVDNLNKRINLFSKRFTRAKKITSITDNQKRSLAENMLRFELLKREALKKGIDKDPEYIKSVKMRVESLLAREYIKSISSQVVAITESELREEYARNKEKRYYRLIGKGKKREKVVEPFNKVKDRITTVLTNKKKLDLINEWKEKMLKAYQFKINESELD
jgi:peptidyl-prolyl cis-trans isomerase C